MFNNSQLYSGKFKVLYSLLSIQLFSNYFLVVRDDWDCFVSLSPACGSKCSKTTAGKARGDIILEFHFALMQNETKNQDSFKEIFSMSLKNAAKPNATCSFFLLCMSEYKSRKTHFRLIYSYFLKGVGFY